MNKNMTIRDAIIGISTDAKYLGGIERFERVDVEALQKLFDQNFIDPNSCQNSSPSNQEFLDFLKKHPRFTVHGYAVHSNRSDYRVSIEGVELNGSPSMDDIKAFADMFHGADDFEIRDAGLFAWYD